MTVNSRNKGKRGELEVAKLLRKYGFEGRRTAQYCGNTGEAADVIGLPGHHLEIKRCEAIRLMDWIRQAERDAKEGEEPAVVFRQSNEDWRIVLNFENYLCTMRLLTDLIDKDYQKLISDLGGKER